MSQEANRWISAFFVFGVGAFLLFNYQNVVKFAGGLVTTGVSLSQGLATIGASGAYPGTTGSMAA